MPLSYSAPGLICSQVESTLPSMTATASATGRPGSIVTTLRAGNTVIVLATGPRPRHSDAYSASISHAARGSGGISPAPIWFMT